MSVPQAKDKGAPPPETWGQTASDRADIKEYQSDARALESRAMPGLARSTLYLVVGLMLTSLLWAAWAQVDRLVVAPGRLTLNIPKLVVQPLETSIIRSLDVKVGDHVRKGQVLAHLDPTFNEASRTAAVDKLDILRAQEARLNAEFAQRPFEPSAHSPALDAEVDVYGRRQQEYNSRLASFDASAAELSSELKAATDARVGLAARIKVAREIEEMRQSLADKQVGSRLQLLQAHSDVAALLSDETSRENQLHEIKTKMATNIADRNSFISTWNREVTDKLNDVHTQRMALEQQAISAGRRASLSELVAQEDSIVVEIATRSVGSVIKEAEPLISLVPVNEPLEAEVQVSTRDIGWVRPGLPVRVKFETLPYQEHGTASGVVSVVTHDSISAPEGSTAKAAYRATVKLDNLSLRGLPKGFEFLPGMQVTAEIGVGKRSVLSYLLNPLTKSVSEAFHEP